MQRTLTRMSSGLRVNSARGERDAWAAELLAATGCGATPLPAAPSALRLEKALDVIASDSVRKAVGQATSADERIRLEVRLARANEQLESMKSQYEVWHSKIAARRQHTIDQAAEEMARPLPVASD